MKGVSKASTIPGQRGINRMLFSCSAPITPPDCIEPVKGIIIFRQRSSLNNKKKNPLRGKTIIKGINSEDLFTFLKVGY